MVSEDQNINNLISGCKAGNRKSQEQLYRSFYRAMMNLCLRYTRSENDALEVLNSGFYKVYKNIHRYDAGKGSLYTWIRTVIINNCLDHIKKKDERPVTGELLEVNAPYIEPAAFSNLSATEILQLVRQLPPATQAVFNLYVMEGYSHSDISEMMNISDGTSKWHLNSARKKLQQMIMQQSHK